MLLLSVVVLLVGIAVAYYNTASLGYDNAKCHDENRYSLNQRRQGYLDGIEDERLGEPFVITNYDWEVIKSFIEGDGGKPAILCPFDNVAIKVLNLMKNNGISVPEQVGIMGFDNIPMLKIFDRLGYTYCGEVFLSGAPRKAYEKVLSKNPEIE